jgi:hypothetical protein
MTQIMTDEMRQFPDYIPAEEASGTADRIPDTVTTGV